MEIIEITQMSKYQAEVAGKRIATTNLMLIDLFTTIDDYRELPAYVDRIHDKLVDFKTVKQELIEWLCVPENLGWVLASDKMSDKKIVIINDPILDLEFDMDESLPLLSLKRCTLQQETMRNKIILAIEAEAPLGKSYSILKAWTNVEHRKHELTPLQVDLK